MEWKSSPNSCATTASINFQSFGDHERERENLTVERRRIDMETNQLVPFLIFSKDPESL